MSNPISTITWINIADEEIEVFVRGEITPRENDSDSPGEVIVLNCKDLKTNREYIDIIDDKTYEQLQSDLSDAFYKK